MELLDKHNLKPVTILKFAGLALVGLIVLAFAFGIINAVLSGSLGGLTSKNSYERSFDSVAQSYKGEASMEMSLRNVAPTEPGNGNVVTGDSAEAYEVTQYHASIETRKLSDTCSAISDLKAKDYVIFENANEHDRGCSFSFKVRKENQAEILAVVESLDPKNLTENIHTIKKLIDDYTSEEDILIKKKETIESTLNDAINSYDEIAKIATQARDAESLAKIIDSKVRIIEKLSQERININAQLDRLGRQKADQLDRLAYTYFYLNIYENKFVDGELIKDSWKQEIKRFVVDINRIAQDSSVGLIKLVFFIIQYALYLIIILLAGKLVWKFGRKLWKK